MTWLRSQASAVANARAASQPSVGQGAQITDRGDAGQERIGAAAGLDKPRQAAQTDRFARLQRQVEPARVRLVGAQQGIVGAGDTGILQAKVQPVARHRLELRAEIGAEETAEQAALFGAVKFRFREITGRKLIDR